MLKDVPGKKINEMSTKVTNKQSFVVKKHTCSRDNIGALINFNF